MNEILVAVVTSILLVGAADLAFAQYDDKLAILETTQGEIVMEFFPNDAPKHVENFINLAQSGFYDGTLFHRIIPGFMIQGGDPNTIDGDPNTWGTGGPSTMVEAEFNTIKHNRGIVSMARSQDPNSAGSQFFIVHHDSNFLDHNYSVFARIVTEESFETLDKIASVETAARDAPVNPAQVIINKITIVDRFEVLNILPLGEPDRTDGMFVDDMSVPQNPRQNISELGVAFSAPQGWLLQQPEKNNEDTPDLVAVGPNTGVINAIISLTIRDTNNTFDELVQQQNQTFAEVAETTTFEIISQEETTIHERDALVTIVEAEFQQEGQPFIVKFKEVLIYDFEKYYALHYTNGLNDFDERLPLFDKSVDEFAILDTDESNENPNSGKPDIESTDESESSDSSESQINLDEPLETFEVDESESSDSSESQINLDEPLETFEVDESESSDSSESTNTDEGGGCLIATAAFGSELAPQVQLLREIRDGKVLNTTSGTIFMTGFNQIYYSFSPTIADLQREHFIFKEAVKLVITPMLYSLSLFNYADSTSEYDILSYGLAIITLNIGMYVAAPAILIYKFRK